jgi:uncharacterized protein (TIGR03435 family)
MRNCPAAVRQSTKIFLILAMFFVGVLTIFQLAVNAQSQNPSPATPQWQIDAGGKMEFDVASVKEDSTPPSPQTVHSNVPIGPQDLYTPTGGLLNAVNYPLFQYMVFAYKLTPKQIRDAISQLPKWATTSRYDIQARASGNPSKDQFRLMMQALLADRFKLAVHFETRQLPVFEMVLDKPGKLGPQLQLHPESAPCSTAPPAQGAAPGPPPTIAGGFPESCGAISAWPVNGRIRAGARNMPMAVIATTFGSNPLLAGDRPILDKTGLSEKYDFVFEFTPEINTPLPPNANFQPDPTGPTFLQALKEQLGLKLEPGTGTVEVIVIDHVEQPSEN